MTQEDKELLLKDLCARLPYSVKFGIGSAKLGRYDLTDIDVKKEKVRYGNGLYADLERYKPYLRPMSSMTEEEDKKFTSMCAHFYNPKVNGIVDVPHIQGYDWLNAHHFDYRGLIEKNLALEAPKDMYNINN